MNLPVKAAVLLGLSLGLVWGCAGGEAKAAGLGPDDTGVAALLLSPSVPTVDAGQAVIIRATGRTVTGGVAPVSVQWSATGGSIVPLSASEAEFSSATAGTYWVRAQEASAPAIVDSASIVVVTPVSPTVSISVLPPAVSMNTGESRQFNAIATRQDGSSYTPAVVWSATGGSISAGGMYSAGNSAGSYRAVAREQGGTLADTATITLVAAPPVLQAVILTPSSVSLTPGATQQFSVSGQWSDGSTTAPAVTFSATGGTVTAGGFYTAGSTVGVFRVVALQQGGGLVDTALVTISEPFPPGVNPNEPAGYVKITEQPFSSATADGWRIESDTPTLATDLEAPVSPSGVLRAIYPSGFVAGGPPWAVDHTLPSPTSLYTRLIFKHSANFEGHASGVNKLGFVWVHDNPSVVLVADGRGSGSLMAVVKLQNVPDSREQLDPNRGASGIVTRGAWHSLEVQLISNTGGLANGIVRWWLDGVLIGQYTDVRFASSGQSNTFGLISVYPIWGGVGGSVANTMSIDFDHIYVSGN